MDYTESSYATSHQTINTASYPILPMFARFSVKLSLLSLLFAILSIVFPIFLKLKQLMDSIPILLKIC